MKTDTSVKVFMDTMIDSPTLNGLVGSQVDIFEKCLVTGFGEKSVVSIVITNNEAVITTSTDHNFEILGIGVNKVGTVIKFSGVETPEELNDEWRISDIIDSTSFKIKTEGLSDQTATGTITVKRAPAGWSKPFSGTNKAAFLPGYGYSQQYLHVLDDDTVPTSASGRWCFIRGYEKLYDIDTGEKPFPNFIQVSQGLQLTKSNASSSASRPWYLVADRGFFYYGTLWSTSYSTLASVYCFGDTGSTKPGDPFSCLIVGNTIGHTDLPSSPGYMNKFPDIATDNGYYVRSYTGLGGPILSRFYGGVGYIGCTYYSYPHSTNNGMVLNRIRITNSSNTYLRSFLPGLFNNANGSPFSSYTTFSNLESLPGKTLMVFPAANGATDTQYLLDITGPWVR